MESIKEKMLAHPKKYNQTYIGHVLDTVSFGSKAIVAGGLTFIHAVFPFMFENTGSQIIRGLYMDLVEKAKFE